MEDRQRSGRAERRPACRGAALGAACLLALLPLLARGEPAPEAQTSEAPAAPVAEEARAPAPAAVDRNQQHRLAAEGFFAADGDRDGLLLAAEAMELTPDRFEAADGDRDGKLTLVEYVDARFLELDATSAPRAPQEAQPPTRGP